MHVVIFNLLHPYRLEGARPHVQGDEGRFNPFGTNFLEQRLVEVQTRGRRRHGARLLVVDGLVALLVGVLVGTVDIGGQRHVAYGFQDLKHGAGVQEVDLEQGIVAGAHLCLHLLPIGAAIEDKAGAGLGRLGRADMGQHAVLVQDALHQHLQLAAAGLLAKHARRNDPGVVEHQQVARVELVQHIHKLTVAQGAALTIELQQAAGGALCHRIAGNQLVWQIKMKIGYLHLSPRGNRRLV